MIPAILNDVATSSPKEQTKPRDDSVEDLAGQFAATLDATVDKDPETRAMPRAVDLVQTEEILPGPEHRIALTDDDEINVPSVNLAAQTTGQASETDLIQTEEAARPKLLPDESAKKPASVMAGRAGQQAAPATQANENSLQTGSRTSVAQSIVEGRLPVAGDATDQLAGRPTTVGEGSNEAAKPTHQNATAAVTEAAQSDNNKVPKASEQQSQLVKSKYPLDEAPEKGAPAAAVDPDIRALKNPAVVAQPPAVALAQMTPQVFQEQFKQTGKTAEADVLSAPIGADRAAGVSQANAPIGSQTAPDTARQVAHQIAVSVTNTPGHATEITLNPEELGRVRLSMTAADGAIVLTVSAERPETLDLLRRHIDILAQEFRDLGYASIDFSFGEQSQHADDAAPTKETIPLSEESDLPANPELPAVDETTTGLDLRI